ncbi:probable G-protein coupled receptor AH9.1 [Littorina saxatilis]|uniref:probable G-protein coupled receptor AH9.1 n=1 Tax=Littorina saxatilis TaxID=31220 RepID=UPI0038B59605
MAGTPSPLYALNVSGMAGVTTSLDTTMDNDDDLYSVMTPEELSETENLFAAALVINKYYLWVLFALGFPGNCAAMVTIFRMRSIGTFPVFVVLLAVMDSLALLVKLLHYQLIVHQVDMGDAGCCILRFLGSWTSAYSSWILVFMALERFAAVRFPLKMTMHSGCNAHKVVMVLVVVGVVIALIYMPLLWTNETVTAATLQCQYKADYARFMNGVYYWVLAALYAFLPFCLLTVFNFMIARQIRSSLKVRSVMRNIKLLPVSQNCHDNSLQRQRPHRNLHAIQTQVNLMLLAATGCFVLLTFPICIYMLTEPYWSTAQGYTHSNAVKFLLRQLAFVFVDSTHAVNFYLYFLTARRFRHHFLRLLACRSCTCSIKSACHQAWHGSDQSELEDL